MQAVAQPTPIAQQSPPAPQPAPRNIAVDTYRGFVMLLMMAEVLRLSRVAQAFPGNWFWGFLAYHQSHVPWAGCSLHDTIQPGFSFLVGVAVPYSIASRIAKGGTFWRMFGHALWRSVLLVALGVFLRSMRSTQTNFTFEDTLSQIGFGYPFLFLLAFRPRRWQWVALAVILTGYWLVWAFYPVPGPDFNYQAVGVPPDWAHHYTGFAAHWNKNSNLAWAFDTWFLNLFPREKPFAYNAGGYATLSFIPTLGTMILGLIAGGVLRSERPPRAKVKWLVLAGVIGLASGEVLGWLGVCPVVKRIWTPSWTLFSGGWCFLLLAGFYAVVDLWGWKRAAFPLAVIGMTLFTLTLAKLREHAVVKALGTGFANGIWVRDVGMVPNRLGQPQVIYSERGRALCRRLGVGEGHLTLSDEAGLIVAVAVLMRAAPLETRGSS